MGLYASSARRSRALPGDGVLLLAFAAAVAATQGEIGGSGVYTLPASGASPPARLSKVKKLLCSFSRWSRSHA